MRHPLLAAHATADNMIRFNIRGFHGDRAASARVIWIALRIMSRNPSAAKSDLFQAYLTAFGF